MVKSPCLLLGVVMTIDDLEVFEAKENNRLHGSYVLQGN
jgi:hypothetical protein